VQKPRCHSSLPVQRLGSQSPPTFINHYASLGRKCPAFRGRDNATNMPANSIATNPSLCTIPCHQTPRKPFIPTDARRKALMITPNMNAINNTKVPTIFGMAFRSWKRVFCKISELLVDSNSAGQREVTRYFHRLRSGL
jgi:hypothetical protein